MSAASTPQRAVDDPAVLVAAAHIVRAALARKRAAEAAQKGSGAA